MKTIFVTLALILTAASCASQSQPAATQSAEASTAPVATPAANAASGIVLGRSTKISASDPGGIYFESHLAVDQKNPQHMIAVSSAAKNGKTYSGFYATFDGGATWQAAKMAGDTPLDKTLFQDGDGIVYVGPSGTVFAAVGTRVNGDPATVVSRSTDGGLTWQTPWVNRYRDRPWMAFDAGFDHAFNGWIYLVGQNTAETADGSTSAHGFFLSRSVDDGKTFSPGNLFLHDAGKPTGALLNPLTSNMQVTRGGLLVEPFLGRYKNETYKPGTIYHSMIRLVTSEDGGRTLSPVQDGPVITTGADDYRASRSDSDPSTAIDATAGKYADRIYVAYSTFENGAYNIHVASTGDLGRTWHSVRVNDNAKKADMNNPAVAVNKDGVVAAIWNDRRDDPTGNCWRLYSAISTDGGEHFLPNQRMSRGQTCTNVPANWQPSTWYEYDNWTDPKHPLPGIGFTSFVPVRFPNGGDTQGLQADSNGVFHTAWINGEQGRMALWQSDFSVSPSILAKMRSTAATFSGATASAPKGMVDVSQDVEFTVDRPVLNFAAHTLSLSLKVVNKTTHTIKGPIQLVVAHMFDPRDTGMGLVHLHPANTDNGSTKDGVAMWKMSAAGDVLEAGKSTAPRTLVFGFTGGVPARPSSYFTPRFYVRAGGE